MDEEAGVPLAAIACTSISFVITILLTLYGYICGFYYSFIGPLLIVVYVLILVTNLRKAERKQRSLIIKGKLSLGESESELRSEGEINGNIYDQPSLLHKYSQQKGAVLESSWRRPPSYCIDGKITYSRITL